jgi:hypothetical protein
MFDYAYLIERLTPLKTEAKPGDDQMERFAQRYRRILDAGCGVSIPDRPMGRPRVGALEAIERLPLPLIPEKTELNRLHRKIAAGARFVITQPVIGKDPYGDLLNDLNVTPVLEAWMSPKIDLLYKSIRRPKDEKAEDYDPLEYLKRLHGAYPDSCGYLSMLGFSQDWKPILPIL